MTHPDVYAPKACILARNPDQGSLPYLMFKLAWDDVSHGEYRLYGDTSLIVREILELPADEDLAGIVGPWLAPHDVGRVDFRALPGIFQEAFARHWTGREIPAHETLLLWAPSYGQDDGHASDPDAVWIVRRLPPGGSAEDPRIGALSYVGMFGPLISALFEQRGW